MDNTNMYETPEENAKLAEPDPEFAEVRYYANICSMFTSFERTIH